MAERERESDAGLSSSVRWLIYKSGGRGNVTGRVMVRNSLKDSFVSQVRHPFMSLSSLFYLLFLTPPFFFFTVFFSLADTLVFPSLAEVINLNHGNEIFASAQPGVHHLWAVYTKVREVFLYFRKIWDTVTVF